MGEELQIRIHGGEQLPTLIYLPGLHGDWTLVGKFRDGITGEVRFVEFTYPRTLTWSLENYRRGNRSGVAGKRNPARMAAGRIFWLANCLAHHRAWKIFRGIEIILAGGFRGTRCTRSSRQAGNGYWDESLFQFSCARRDRDN